MLRTASAPVDTQERVGDVAIEGAVQAERLRIAMRTAATPLTSMAAALVVAGTLSYSEQLGRFVFDPCVIAWAAVMVPLLICSRASSRLAEPGSPWAMSPSLAARFYAAFGTVMGLAWGSAMWFFLPEASPTKQVFLVAATAAILAGGAATQSAHTPLVWSYALPLATLAAAALFRQGDAYLVAMGVGFFVLAVHMAIFSRAVQRSLEAKVRLALINERLHREAEAARAEATRADAAKAMVIAATSHDLRQPLHALVQYVARLKDEPASENQATLVRRIDESVEVLQGLLDAVLDYSIVTEGRTPVRAAAVSLPLMLSQVEAQLRPQAESKGLRLVVQDADIAAMTDAALLQRVLLNLAQNALRYTPAGTITLRLARTRGGGARFLVADTGVGLRAAQRERIFDDYYQADNPGRDRSRGLGLGLAIVRELTAALGLRIRVKSWPGRGSVFAIEVPAERCVVRPGPLAAPEPPHPSTALLRGAPVLLIDDDALARDSLALTLAGLGCCVTAAASADEALLTLQHAELLPQCLVCDYRLRDGATGLDAVARVRGWMQAQYGGGAALPAVVITGDPAPEVEARAAALGCRVLRKPVAPAQLQAELAALLGPVMAALDDRLAA